MAEKGFDLSALVSEISKANVSGSDTRKQIEYIPLDLIDADENNFYSIDGVDALAGNIELNGLQQPLLLRPSPNGRYKVVSGHRRREALLLIQKDGSDQFADGVPCLVDRTEAPEALQRLQLIMANSDTRKLTSADQNAQAEQIEDLLRELVDQGYQFPGRLRDWVSELSGMSRTKLARLKVIRDGLEPTIKKKYYDKGKLKESSAYELARLPGDIQLQIVDWYLQKHDGKPSLEYLWESSIKDYAKDIDRLDKLVCRKTAGGGPCINSEGILKHLYGGSYRSYSGTCSSTSGSGCCANCGDITSCKYVCDRMKAKAEAEKKKLREQRKDERAAQKSADEAKIARIEHLWFRYGQALDRAGFKSDKAFRQKIGRPLYEPDELVKALLDGSSVDTKTTTASPFGYTLRMDECKYLVEFADTLGCSLDYLFLRTDVPDVGGAGAPLTADQPVAVPADDRQSPSGSHAEWIPVSGRLPKLGEDVLVFDSFDHSIEIDNVDAYGEFVLCEKPTCWTHLPWPEEANMMPLRPVDPIHTPDASFPIWHREPEPPAEGRYLCLVDMNTATLHEQRCDWRDGAWYAYGQPIHDTFTVKAWWPLPKEAPTPSWWVEDEEEEET